MKPPLVSGLETASTKTGSGKCRARWSIMDEFVASLFYPFIPVRVTPWMKYFWAKKKITTTGSVISSEPAIIIP